MLEVLKLYVKSNITWVRFDLFISPKHYEFKHHITLTGKELLDYLEEQQDYEIVQLVLGNGSFDNQVYIQSY